MAVILSDQFQGRPAYRLSDGVVSILCVPSLGGRVMSLTFHDQELLYVPGSISPLDLAPLPDEDVGVFKKREGFRIFGGDKVWVAPEKSWWEGCPPVDLDAGAYRVQEKDGRIMMESPVCRETGLQITREIVLTPDGQVSFTERFLNTTDQPLRKGIWVVTQLKKPFVVSLPAFADDARSYHLEDPTLPDPGVSPLVKDGLLHIPCEGSRCHKFGVMPWQGRADVQLSGVRLVCSFVFDRSAAYAHGAAVEVFNSHLAPYGEVELHAPIVDIAPGQSISFLHEWLLLRG